MCVHNFSLVGWLGPIRFDSIRQIAADGVEHVVAGTDVLVYEADYHIDHLREDVMAAMESVQSKLSRQARGVHVQASTLGSLEALLEFLSTIPIPVASFSIGACRRLFVQCM